MEGKRREGGTQYRKPGYTFLIVKCKIRCQPYFAPTRRKHEDNRIKSGEYKEP